MKSNKVVYFHINPLTNKVFYVGIGNLKRAFYKGEKRSSFWCNEVNKYGYIIDIIHEGLTMGEAKVKEVEYIKRFGRRDLGKGSLVNLTDGGEGVSGRIISEEWKKKASERMKGDKRNVGRKRSKETREKLSKINKGKKHSEETKRKISESNKGKVGYYRGKPSPNKGKKLSKEAKQKKSERMKGRKLSPESIVKRTATQKRNRELKLQELINNLK